MAVFCQRVQPRLVSCLAVYLGEVGVAEEVAQEALVRAWERWATVSVAVSPEAWVYRVAFNLSKSRLRRRVLERRHRSQIRADDRELAAEVADRLTVHQALRELPARQRVVIILRYLGDFSVADTAVAMGCAPGTVKALSSQALLGLRARLDLADPDKADQRG